MKTLYACAAASAALAFTSASAQEAPPNQMVHSYTVETLEPLLTQFNFTHERRITDSEQVFLKITRNDKTMMLMPTACTDAKCVGLLMVAPVTDSATPAEVNKYNQSTYYTSAVLENDGSLYLQRYLISDHGTTVGTFEVNLNVFETSIDEWFSKKAGNAN